MECRHLKLVRQKAPDGASGPIPGYEINWCKKKTEAHNPLEMIHVKAMINSKAFELKLPSNANDFFCPFSSTQSFEHCPYLELGEAERIHEDMN